MSWIITLSGKKFNYANPSIDAIDINDIAQALSHECRFAGHTPCFYSVAQHSVNCSYNVAQGFELEALLHDAAEAYCKDIPTPLKKLLPDYKAIENKIAALIRDKFNLPFNESHEVKQSDLTMLATEYRDLKLDKGIEWPILNGITPAKGTIFPVSSVMACHMFLRRFKELTGAYYE